MATSQENLRTLQSMLARIEADPSQSGSAAAEFWDAFYDLYLLNLRGKSPALASEFLAFVDVEAARLEAQMYTLESAQFDRLESKLNSIWEFDEWLTMCRQKSALEGFNELCVPYFGSDYRLGDDEEFDDDLRARADKEGFASTEEDPSLFPDTHWWWTYNKPIGKFGM